MDLERAAPGPVSAVHAAALLADGSDESSCSACHGGWFESLAGACTDCHGGIEDDLDDGRGLHGNLPSDIDPDACGSCHGEHNGPGFQLAGPRSFKLAGAGSRETFDHARLGVDLDGAHLELECAACHLSADVQTLPVGTQRFRGLDADCKSCHTNDHAPVFPSDCNQCHDQSDWGQQSYDRHPAFFARQGAHAEADCRDCHAAGSESSLEAKLGRRGGGLPEVRTCAECHLVPHGEAFLAAASPAGGELPDADCAACHDVTRGPFALAAETLDPAVHGAAGFDLDSPHASLDCTACHGEVGDAEATERSPEEVVLAFAARHPGRERLDCAACHTDPHGGQFLDTGEPEDCVSCHVPTAFEGHAFDDERHAVLRLELTGGHAGLDCGACHLVDAALVGESVRAFRGTDAECAACHLDAHAGFPFENADGENCAACHEPVAFAGARKGFPHDSATGFELLGAHAEEACEACHLPALEADATGRTFGRVAALFGALAGTGEASVDPHDSSAGRFSDDDCARCHTDVHAGAFESANSCADCHSRFSFRSGLEPFEHGPATGFELDGQHAALDCTACHAEDPSAPRGRAFAAGPDCASCHADNHGGQFESSPRGADCARCHATDSPFREPLFHHDLDSDFRLEGKHRTLACASCHGLESIDGSAVRRYWPVDSDCAACHGVEEAGSLRKRLGRGVSGDLKKGGL